MHGVAIIGCGQISDLHAAAYTGGDTARIVALADPDREAAEAKRQLWGVPEAGVYTDYRDVLERGDVDIAEILVPHDLHYEIAAAALAAGKHVSLQKPMAISLDQADSLVRAAGTAPGLLRVFENFLFYPPVQRAKAIIDSGQLGDLHTVLIRSIAGHSHTAWPPPKEAWRIDPGRCGGSPMIFDDGHHTFAMALYLAGPIARVHTSVRRNGGYGIDIPAMVTWEHGNGILGSWTVSASSTGSRSISQTAGSACARPARRWPPALTSGRRLAVGRPAATRCRAGYGPTKWPSSAPGAPGAGRPDPS